VGAVGIDTAKSTTQRAVQRGRNEEVGWHLACYPCRHGAPVWERAGKKDLKKVLTLYRIRDTLYIVGNEYDKQKNEGGNKND